MGVGKLISILVGLPSAVGEEGLLSLPPGLPRKRTQAAEQILKNRNYSIWKTIVRLLLRSLHPTTATPPSPIRLPPPQLVRSRLSPCKTTHRIRPVWNPIPATVK